MGRIKLTIILLFFGLLCSGQTNSFVTEYYLSQHFAPKAGITAGTNNTVWMDCDQITARYNVSIVGETTTGHRLPSQSQISNAYTVTINSISNALPDRFQANCTVSNYSGQNITARGVVFALHTSPNTSDYVWNNALGGGGNYSVTPYYSTGYPILPGQVYYVRAYTIRDGSTITYSTNEISIQIPYPQIESNYWYALEDCSTIMVEGRIGNIGSLSVTGKGVCWKNVTNNNYDTPPTTSDYYSSYGSGSANWESSASPLTHGQYYYARIYVNLSNGNTYYGGEWKYIKLESGVQNAAISYPYISSITSTSAVITGSTYNRSCANQISRGILYGLYEGDSRYSVLVEGDNGTFTKTLTGLSPNTTYYLRFSVSYYNIGSVTSQEITFKTLP